MEISNFIGSIIALILMIVPLVIYYNTKDRKEQLLIVYEQDMVRLLLGDDDYCDFDISDIKDDQKRINEELVKVIKARAKELVKFVDRVIFFKDGDKIFEKKLFEIIQQAKA